MNANKIIALSRRVLQSNVVDWAADTVTTAAAGADFVALSAQAARLVTLIAPSVALDVRRTGTATHLSIPAGSSLSLALAADCAEVEVRRTDRSNTQIDVGYIWES